MQTLSQRIPPPASASGRLGNPNATLPFPILQFTPFNDKAIDTSFLTNWNATSILRVSSVLFVMGIGRDWRA
jgi:hypothetical protein